MLIKSISLENFRQFKGKQTIEFSIDPERNVTVVKGENGAGKTTLLEAFRWCFYSDFNLPNPDKTLNTDVSNKLAPRDTETVSVEINFRHTHHDYIIKRFETYMKDNAGECSRLSRDITLKRKNSSGTLTLIKNDEINNILPADLSTYFFFDGERIENLSKPGNKGKKDISQAVRNVLGLDILLNAKKHLKKVSEEFEKEYNDSNSNEIERVRNLLYEKRHKAEEHHKIIRTTEEEIKRVETKIRDREEKIKANATFSHLQKRREQLERETKSQESSIEYLIKDIEKNSKDLFPEFLANKLLNLSANKIDLGSIESKGIIGVDGSAIDHIIQRGECICGQKIVDGSEAYNKLLIQKDYQPPASLGTIMTQFNEKTEDVKSRAEGFFETFNEKYIKIEEYKDNIENIRSEIEDISNQLLGAENVKILEDERKQLTDERRELEVKVAIVKEKLKVVNDEILSEQKNLDKLALTNERNKGISLRKDYSVRLEELLSNYYIDKEDKVRNELNKKVSKIFDKLIDTNHKIEINEDYTFRVVDIDGEDATSQGQDVITSFAFIGGLIDLAKKEHKDIEVTEPYPLLMDAPFAKLSKVHRKNVANILPRIAEQFILFTVDSQYEGDIEETLISRIGRQYELIMHTEDEKFTEIR
jgi:DNA sulfur modification protein DndD